MVQRYEDLDAILTLADVAPDACPVLPQLRPGNWLRPAHTAALWQVALWRRQYPECQRINGGGVCGRCCYDVISTHIAGEATPNGYAAQPQPAPAPEPQPSPTPPPAPLVRPSAASQPRLSQSSPDDDTPPESGLKVIGTWRPL